MPAIGTVNVGGVDAAIHLADSGPSGVEESVAEGQGPQVTAVFQVPWGQRYDFLKGLAGSATGGPGGIVRTVPFAYPPSPNLYAVAVPSIKGLGKPKWDGSWITYDTAVVQVTFGIPRWSFESGGGNTDPSGKPWTTTRFRLTAEFLQPTYGGTFSWTEGGPQSGQVVPGSVVPIIVPHAEISMVRHWMPYIPVSESMELLGSVNVDPITLGNRQFPAKTVLFAGLNATEAADTLGNRVYECEYVLLGNYERTWSDVMQQDGIFYNVNTKADGSGNEPYPTADFWNGLP